MSNRFLMRAHLISFGLVSAQMMVSRLDRRVVFLTSFMGVAS